MKELFCLKPVVTCLLFGLLLASCEKDNEPSPKEFSNVQTQSNSIVKDFEIKESWFAKSNLKSVPINGDIYANFGVGYDVITNSEMLPIFNPGVSVSPIVSTSLAESTSLLYTYTSDYNQIDQKVTSALAAALNVSTSWVKANANVSVSRSSNISSSSSSVYVSVLYIKKYGKGNLVYTAPSVNNYLTYGTNLINGGQDGITLSNTQFRNIYGDKFKSALTFGVLLVGTVQVTNVNFSSYSKEDIAAQASVAVQNMISANASWQSQQATFTQFSNSGIIVSCTAIPRTSAYANDIPGLIAQEAYMDQCYANNDLGVIAEELTKFGNLYPTYQFINVEEQELHANSCPIYFNKIRKKMGIITMPYYSELSCGSSVSDYSLLGKWFNSNYDDSKLKPLYWAVPQSGYLLAARMSDIYDPLASSCEIRGFVFKQKIYSYLVPLYMARDTFMGWYEYNTNGVFGTNYDTPVLLGWIFPY